MEKALFEQLNAAYSALGRRASALRGALEDAGIPAVWNWYAYHSTLIDGEYRVEEFPIPVVDAAGGSHQGGCDIGFHMDEMFVEFQMTCERAFGFDFGQLPQPFEVYGVEDYLHDFYRPGMDLDGIAARIMASGEKMVGVSLTLPGNTETAVLVSVVQDCRRWIL